MIWIIGCNGMLATDVINSFHSASIITVETDRNVDITNIEALRTFVSGKGITHIVNCSAYTAVDDAEDNSELAYLINETGVKNIAIVAKELDIPLFHISTDYVFDGNLDAPLTEDMDTDPIGVYGASKLAGENKIREICEKYFIVRTAWLYGKNGNSFVSTMIRLMNDRDSLGVIGDQWGTPTWAGDLANLLLEIVTSKSTEYGTYHFSNEGKISWFDFAVEIYKQGQKSNLITSDCEINKITTDQYPTKAKRPSFSLLSKEKTSKTFGVTPVLWQNSLEKFIGELK